MSQPWHPNLQILANAGSGKTYTLVTRIIRLLVIGVNPRHIIALTFTRKAAGEFLSKLLQRLASAALDPQAAAQLSATIGEKRDCSSYRRLLREVVQDLGKLQLTTLDSFFHRIIAAFPQELGLSGAPTLLDSHAKKVAVELSLRHALARLTKSERDLLIQSLFERDEDSIRSSSSKDLNDICESAHELFLDHPDIKAWGNPKRIWGSATNPWKALSPTEHLRCCEIVDQETGSPEFSTDARNAWLQLQELIRGVVPNAGVSKIMASLNDWKTGSGKFFHRKSYEISSAASQAAETLVEHYLYECTEYRLREARAMHHLLSHYEAEYEGEVRRRGMLSFSDVTRLLQPHDNFMGLGRTNTTSSTLRLQLDERLDALFDHWLLDEFQDTSRGQYRALENILDEVISEAARGGERSFFCVGDIKQAIYGWRQGDSRLFDELYQRYRFGDGLLREELSISWRSSEEILSTLNSIFGDLDRTVPSIPESVRDRWKAAWSHHRRSSTIDPLPGFFSWNTYDPKEEGDLEDQIIDLLHEMQARLKEGMTIALLVRSGKAAKDWLETLRHAGIDALSESNPPVGRDNPVAAALRSTLSLSTHPGDLFAQNHLMMEPLRGIFFASDDHERELASLVSRSAELLVEGGFAAVTKWILEKLAPLIRDQFGKDRAAALLRAARKADSSGITSVDEFLTFLEGYEEQGRSAPHAVQIMTVHKSKGLEYDMVIIPLASGQEALDSFDNKNIKAWQNEQGEPFVMKLPAEGVRNVSGNEPLAEAAAHQRSDSAFEELCVWYVALSRAKRALYIFSQEPKKLGSDKCPSFPQLLAAGLTSPQSPSGEKDHPPGQLKAMMGDPDWYLKFQPQPQNAQSNSFPLPFTLLPRAASLQKYNPSDTEHRVIRAEQAFLDNNATLLGSEVHGFFESFDWLKEDVWALPPTLSSAARELLAPFFTHPAVRELFITPKTPHLLWREQRFDLVLDSQWLSGCFDRVLIYLNEAGVPVSADLIDFKTDQGGREKLIASHSSQMQHYRRALSSILSLSENQIRTILIHLRSKDPVIVLP